ncbi:MAG: DUF4178 domain-containing protein [Chitinophaga sp.]|uniref:DUF4178 domain-containing protein n=1 Tax=Chitinophaga sp. TaxID=1869181 RepID=UPI0025BC5980|nr:DUF4178 domain-containing protein [Chitinophaga sp.]MBV8253704.1 DUF4178 domain-containing protein [Chitinophaga sp.]
MPHYNCSGCHQPFEMQYTGDGFYGCPNCHSLLRVRNGDVSSTIAMQGAHRKQWIQIGTEGTLHGEKYRIIGYIERLESGTVYYWSEYVMQRLRDNTTVFLAEYGGHWNLMEPIPDKPFTNVKVAQSTKTLLYQDKEFQAFSRYSAKYTYIVGEIPWELLYKKATKCVEFIRPPYMLAIEMAEQENHTHEFDTFHGTYIYPAEIRKGFLNGKYPPRREGVGPTQPFSRFLRPRQFVYGTLLFCLIAILFSLYSNGSRKNIEVFNQKLVIDSSAISNKQIVSPSYSLDADYSNLEIEFYSDVNNNWAALDLALVNENTGKEYAFGMESSLYRGVEDGESWSEGSAYQKAFICGVTRGTYHFVMSTSGEPRNGYISANVSAKYDVPTYWNEVLLCIILGVAAIGLLWWESKFNEERWFASNINFKLYEDPSE